MQVIPIAGNSSRFFEQGYNKVKYMLLINNKTVLEHILQELNKNEKTLLILHSKFNHLIQVKEILIKLKFKCFDVVEIHKTDGQLTSVISGIKSSIFNNYKGPLWIYNGDTIRLRPLPFDIFKQFSSYNGFIEVFKESGDHWSFVDNIGEVKVVTEKEKISDYCSSGLYGFKSLKNLIDLYENEIIIFEKGERYISPIFNLMISKGQKIYSFKTPRNIFMLCGTPEEFEKSKNHIEKYHST